MLTARRPSTVVLFLPPYSGEPLGPPAGLLAVATPLVEAGYDVRVVDAAIDPDFESTITESLPDALCLGISLLTGPMIEHTLRVVRRVKQRRPELPVVLGGWHPSTLPEQTIAHELVDVVVENQGELTFREIVDRFDNGESLEGVAGCLYKAKGRVRKNPSRPTVPIEQLPPAAWHLVDFDAYERAGAGRKLPYASSVGCPYQCRYCSDIVVYKRRFNPYAVERTVREVVELVRQRRLEEVALLDSNFLVDLKRALAIAEGFRDSGVRFRWTFQASTDLLCRLSDSEVRSLAQSGVSHIGFGTESASESVLKAMEKRHQKIADLYEAARKTRQAGIRVTYNLIFGFPGETEADRDETLRVMGDIAERYDNVTFSPNVFTPYPGIPVWQELERLGVKRPDSLEGWANMPLGANLLPWMKGAPYQRLERRLKWFHLHNALTFQARNRARAGKRLVAAGMRRLVSWRLKKQFYAAGWELGLHQLRRQLSMRRSLLTGRGIGYRLDPTG